MVRRVPAIITVIVLVTGLAGWYGRSHGFILSRAAPFAITPQELVALCTDNGRPAVHSAFTVSGGEQLPESRFAPATLTLHAPTGPIELGTIDHPAFAGNPVVSPDSTRLAFTQRGSVFVIRLDGTDLKRLTDPWENSADQHPAWSPDSRWIAFVRTGYQDDTDDIFAVSAQDGQTLLKLTMRSSNAPAVLSIGSNDLMWSSNYNVAFVTTGDYDQDHTEQVYLITIYGLPTPDRPDGMVGNDSSRGFDTFVRPIDNTDAGPFTDYDLMSWAPVYSELLSYVDADSRVYAGNAFTGDSQEITNQCQDITAVP